MIKIMTLFAVAVLVIVFLKSLFPLFSDKGVADPVVEVEIKGMQGGDIRKVRWGSREIGILKRNNKQLDQLRSSDETLVDSSSPLFHSSLDKASRSRRLEFFVYFNSGDSGNCPLFYDSLGFKDICSGIRFDTTGREVGKELTGKKLEIPPHKFETQNGKLTGLLIGRW